ncbi:MAG: YifB family Mg chelatase-like AAA ATPase [Campylobacterales bacterium]
MKLLKSATLIGKDAKSVDVEIGFTNGLPGFSIVGLAQGSVVESKDRVKSSLLINNLKLPPKKIVINLSPSDLNKRGSHFDLPIALGVGLYNEDIDFSRYYFFGELGLDGVLRDSDLIFPLVLSLAKEGCLKKVVVPEDSKEKIALIPGVELFAFSNIVEVFEFFRSDKPKGVSGEFSIDARSFEVENESFYFDENIEEDFADVRGQEFAKRAALISATGFHNILLEGSPGSGKSMIAKRLPYILPPLKRQEILEIAMLKSFEGQNPDFRALRPFRAPHSSSSKSSIFGGGNRDMKPGEVSYANLGVLFFDEFPSFAKTIIESLREPLENHKILISRVNAKIEYEADFLFVAAQNPCPCGNLFSSTKECRCSQIEINRYQGKISEPVLDRIDLYVKMDEVTLEDRASISSKDMREMVFEAYKLQRQRGQSVYNSRLSGDEFRKSCSLEKESEELLSSALKRFGLSLRSADKIVRVARTIADLSLSKDIKKQHIIEALGFRKR